MEQQALGLIETIGYTAAVSAADAALKAANVTLEAMERIIGVGGMLGVTIHLSGEVAAVASAVEAGKAEAGRVGTLVSAHVIPRAHDEVGRKVLSRFQRPGAGFRAEEPFRRPQAAGRSGKSKPASPAPEKTDPADGL